MAEEPSHAGPSCHTGDLGHCPEDKEDPDLMTQGREQERLVGTGMLLQCPRRKDPASGGTIACCCAILEPQGRPGFESQFSLLHPGTVCA